MPRLGSSSGDFGSAVGHLLEDRGPGVSGAPGPRQGPGGTVEFANQLRVGRRTELGVLRAAAETGTRSCCLGFQHLCSRGPVFVNLAFSQKKA